MTSVIQTHKPAVAQKPHPTLLIFYGDLYEIQPLVQRVQDRLQAYVASGAVQVVSVESGDDVQHIMLPAYESWLGFDNLQRYTAANEDTWAQLDVDVSQINVLVVVLDQLADAADLQALYQRVSQHYVGRGVDTIPTSLLWYTETVVPTMNLNYKPQMYVHPRRVRDALATIEHAVVNWVAADLLSYVDQRLADIQAQHKNKHVTAIWLGAAGVYIDEAYSMRAFFDRMIMLFMQAWRTPPIDVRTDDELRTLAQAQAQSYRTMLSQTIQTKLYELGWRFEAKQPYQYELNRVDGDTVSGVPRKGLDWTESIFAKASDWWLGASDRTALSIVSGLARKFGLLVRTSDETAIAPLAEIQQALQMHYQTVNVECQMLMHRLHEQTYSELQQFFVRQLANVDHAQGENYGLKRMITVMQKYIAQIDAMPRMMVHNQLVDKVQPVMAYSALDANSMAEYARAHATQLQQLKQKWTREYAGLMSLGGMFLRLLVTYPMILSLIYAFMPMYYFENYAMTAAIVAVVMLVGGVGYVTNAYHNYYKTIEQQRDAFFVENMAPLVLSITAHWTESNRQQLLMRLQRLSVVYQDIENKVQQSQTHVPLAIDNINTPARFVIRRLDRVFGTSQQVVDARFRGLPWDAVRNETVWCYTAEQQYWLSWMSEIKARLNQHGEYRAEITMLQQMVANVFQQRRGANSGIVYLEEQIAGYIPELMKRDPIALEVLVEDVPELQTGKKWMWLRQNAQVDVVPRNTTGFQVTKNTLLVLSQQGIEALVGLTGTGNSLFQPVDTILATRLPHEMIRLEFEFDVK